MGKIYISFRKLILTINCYYGFKHGLFFKLIFSWIKKDLDLNMIDYMHEIILCKEYQNKRIIKFSNLMNVWITNIALLELIDQ